MSRSLRAWSIALWNIGYLSGFAVAYWKPWLGALLLAVTTLGFGSAAGLALISPHSVERWIGPKPFPKKARSDLFRVFGLAMASGVALLGMSFIKWVESS
jgi:hypothetical protein